MRKTLVPALLAGLVSLLPNVSARLGFPDPMTPRGETVESLYVPIMWIAIIMTLIVFAIMGYVLLRYREGTGKGKATYEKERHNTKAEVFWTVVPLIIVGWVGFASYGGMVSLDAAKHDGTTPAFEILVTGSQWNWNAHYGTAPSGAAIAVDSSPGAAGAVDEANYFLVPADTPIAFNITSSDVIHAFGIFDPNGSYFGMNDANPLGSNKYAHEVYSFPEGEYKVMCKEMCLNPGHAYMRAVIKSVPAAEYGLWFKGKGLGAGASILNEVTFTADAAGAPKMTAGSNVTVTGSRVLATLVNDGASAVTFHLLGGQDVLVPAKTTDVAAFEVTAPGKFLVTTGSGAVEMQGVAVDETIKVDLGNYALLPAHLDLKVGKTYLIQSTNVHSLSHNLAIGKAFPDAVVQSPTVGGGQTASLVFKPTEAGAWQMWCAISGHHDGGMKGTVTITA